MFRNTLIGGVAAAALAVSGFAFAQGSGGSSGGGASGSGAASGATSSGSGAPSGSSNMGSGAGAPRGAQNSQTDVQRGVTGGANSTTTQSPGGAQGTDTGVTQSGRPDAGGASSQSMTTGQIPKVQVSEKQRTELRTRFRQANVRTVNADQVDVTISVGAVLPSTVTFAAIPAPIVTIVPEFRGYQAVRVGDQILIVEPGTRRIVYIVEG